MNLLAIDIGGTRSRFGHCHYLSKNDFSINAQFEFLTKQDAVNNLHDLLACYDNTCIKPFLPVNEYPHIVIAIAGPVIGKSAFPPNINWNIDLSQSTSLPETFLLNDFAAQAYGLLVSNTLENLKLIKQGNNSNDGTIAIVGAGTGLGHCLLVIQGCNGNAIVYPSEAGQAGFCFERNERHIEDYFLAQTGHAYATNDMVVSGAGIEKLHACLTGHQYSAARIFTEPDANSETIEYFSRFYGRACRNYCLSTCVTDGLVISGGLAARQPTIINEHFLQEFTASTTHQYILNGIRIYLNQDESSGLCGACLYALDKINPI